jgi:hypothetical protein
MSTFDKTHQQLSNIPLLLDKMSIFKELWKCVFSLSVRFFVNEISRGILIRFLSLKTVRAVLPQRKTPLGVAERGLNFGGKT